MRAVCASLLTVVFSAAYGEEKAMDAAKPAISEIEPAGTTTTARLASFST